jgi:hypothetical protein
MNLSYERFQNTLRDLKDCSEVMNEMNDEDRDSMYDKESPAMRELIILCGEIFKKYGGIK